MGGDPEQGRVVSPSARVLAPSEGALAVLGPAVPADLPCPLQPGPVTEMDGSVATDFFTVLSTGQRFTEDQRLNVQAFSMLRAWLLQGGPERLGATDAGRAGRAPGRLGQASWAPDVGVKQLLIRTPASSLDSPGVSPPRVSHEGGSRWD